MTPIHTQMCQHLYQFQKKGNETQFLFNTTVDEHVDAARKELAGQFNNLKTFRSNHHKFCEMNFWFHAFLLIKSVQLLLKSKVPQNDIDLSEKFLKKFRVLLEQYYGTQVP